MDWNQKMVYDVVGPHFFSAHPNSEPVADQPLYNGCDEFQLLAVARLFNIKAENNKFKRCYDQVSQWASDMLPRDHTLPSDYYNTKKLIRDLGLPMEKIHALEPRNDVHEAEYMFLTIVIPSPSNPKRRIDVYLEPLIEELLRLWHIGVLMHIHATNKAFMMRVVMMWTVNDLPACGMAYRWTTAESFYPKIARPRLTRDEICHKVEQYGTAIEEPLTYPPCYGNVHKWTKKSIFWDLPHWNMHLIQHNLDVMHIEKNMFDNIFNTVMDIKGKTKNNLNSCKDLKNICNRPELEVDKHKPNAMPKAAYTLTKEQKKTICTWKLILVAFRELHPKLVWSALIEVRILFQVLWSITIDVKKVQELEENIAIIMCHLEKIFPPAFFDLMEYLIVHLPYEARVGGPVQYRWMYQFERPSRNDELTQNNDRVASDIFNCPGRTSGVSTKRHTLDQERHVMETSFLNVYETYSPDDPIIHQIVTTNFKAWFKSRVEPELQNIENDLLKSLCWGPN
ncbi:UNVERIFIED_CONTAM: hypothetical protein Sangu_2658800 [Sesamum angustifolium]|uniref:DUF4218 domain-containing protein n=1 Tax=Sesamum angustifolium TaxID=2727405 RepID=A0AAW2J298_9LAMI